MVIAFHKNARKDQFYASNVFFTFIPLSREGISLARSLSSTFPCCLLCWCCFDQFSM